MARSERVQQREGRGRSLARFFRHDGPRSVRRENSVRRDEKLHEASSHESSGLRDAVRARSAPRGARAREYVARDALRTIVLSAARAPAEPAQPLIDFQRALLAELAPGVAVLGEFTEHALIASTFDENAVRRTESIALALEMGGDAAGDADD